VRIPPLVFKASPGLASPSPLSFESNLLWGIDPLGVLQYTSMDSRLAKKAIVLEPETGGPPAPVEWRRGEDLTVE